MSGNNGRHGDGTFAKGNPGGPGRPRREREREYLAVLSEAVPLDKWRAIVERAVVDATAGDARSRDWISKYLVPEVVPEFEQEEVPREQKIENILTRVARLREFQEVSERLQRQQEKQEQQNDENE
ncbi:MAG: hypothetical protein K8T91_20125 [Planctomycetes bacterium]|nr:hypothetical protein [Planctomycetota bacterium]